MHCLSYPVVDPRHPHAASWCSGGVAVFADEAAENPVASHVRIAGAGRDGTRVAVVGRVRGAL